MKTLLAVTLFVLYISAYGKTSVPIVKNGNPAAVIVTADQPSPVAAYAANELADYIKKATGATLPVIRESAVPKHRTCIYVGATRAAAAAGLGQEKFSQEAYYIKATGGHLYLVGGENEKKLFYERDAKSDRSKMRQYVWDNGIVRDTRRGTLYAIYDFLDCFPGIKWLWPGELGTYIPRTANIIIPSDFERKGAPAFLYRKYRIVQITDPYFCGQRDFAEIAKLGFSKEALGKYCMALRKFLLRYQEGESAPLPASEANHITNWWKLYGKEHPNWFAMRDDGDRSPRPGEYMGQNRLCVSDPGLHQFIVEKFWDGGEWLGLGEADTRGFCRCKKCMEWDQPQPEGFQGYSTTNRYVKYAQAVRKLALKRNPNVKITLLIYMDYFMPPSGKPDLSWASAKFVPWGSGIECWYPMKEDHAKRLIHAWDEWAATGIRLRYRPNYLLSGYTLPALDVRQSGEMISHTAKKGSLGYDYDSLIGHWATKGPMLYVHMRLGADPTLPIDRLLNEYYSAFGPASEEIRKYFDYWIEYSRKIPDGGLFRKSHLAAKYYPPAVFQVPEQILAQALLKAEKSGEKDFAERVRFLQNGLAHGKMSVEFCSLYAQNKFSAALEKMNQIITFRRKHENSFFVDLEDIKDAESRAYPNLRNLIRGKVSYFSDPPLHGNNGSKFKRELVHEMAGLRAVKSSLILPKNRQSGYVVFRYDAGKDNCFLEAVLSITAWSQKISNRVDISFDGVAWEPVKSDAGVKDRIDLSSNIAGKKLFYLRFSAFRRSEFPGNQMSLYRFRLDYTKKFPDVEDRKELDIGTGWLDFKGDWYFQADSRSIPVEKLSYNFSADGWKKVSVPDFLDNTPIGTFSGYGWYAVEFFVPQDWSARSVDFLFEAVDEQAWVYVNGRKVGEHSVESEKQPVGVLWKLPFIVNVPAENIKAGKKNLLCVRIHSALGASGIWKPVKIRPVDASAQ